MIAGQSNAVGIGTSNQAYSGAAGASLFGNDYAWHNLTDPTDSVVAQVDAVSLDVSPAPGGSYWPLLATQRIALNSIPIAFVPCPLGATAILAWQPGADHEDRNTLYGSMVHRARQIQGGVKAVLWHQGESDATVTGFTTGAVYDPRLDTLADAVFADLGVKLIAAKIHKWDGAPSTTQGNVDEINGAIGTAWGDNAHVGAGPNFDSPSRVTASLHFTTNAELLDAATRWEASLEALGW